MARRVIGTMPLLSVVLLGCQLTASAVDADGAERFMQENILISLEEPSLAIAVDDAFSLVGNHTISIRDVGAGERFVFVEAEGSIIRRLFIVQFEGFLPGVDDYFRYDLSGKPVVASYPFRSNGYSFDMAESIAANSTGESAATNKFLQSKGYSVPTQWMMWRSLTIADEARKKEMILFYVEDLASTGLTLADLYVDDAATDAWINLQKDLEIRANDSFKLTALDGSGNPIVSGWSSIPNQFKK